MEGTELTKSEGDTMMSSIFDASIADKLAQAGVEDTPYALHLPKGLDKDLWEEGCADVRGVEGRLLTVARFKLGDYANFAVKEYNLTYAQIGERMDLAAGTVEQICQTSRNVPDLNRAAFTFSFSAARKVETLLPRFQRKALERAKKESGKENPSVVAVEDAVKDIIAEHPKARRRVAEPKETKPKHASTIRVTVSIITDGYRKGKGNEKETWPQFDKRVTKVFNGKAKAEVPIELRMYRNPDLKAQAEEDERKRKKAKSQTRKDKEAAAIAEGRKKLGEHLTRLPTEVLESNEALKGHLQAVGLALPLKEREVEDVNVLPLPLVRILKGIKTPKAPKAPKAPKEKKARKAAAPKARRPARKVAAKKSSAKKERKSIRVSTRGLPFARPSDK